MSTRETFSFVRCWDSRLRVYHYSLPVRTSIDTRIHKIYRNNVVLLYVIYYRVQYDGSGWKNEIDNGLSQGGYAFDRHKEPLWLVSISLVFFLHSVA